MPSQTINVFVSYSHADASLVAPVVQVLRVNKSLVFQDADGIEPGTKWRDAIANALSKSNLVVVFWCHHACRSNEVSSEWKAAIEQGKDLLPLLLDKTPLPSELSAFQWIDFRGTVGSNHEAEPLSGEAPKSESSPRQLPPDVLLCPSPPTDSRPTAPKRRVSWLVLAGVAAAAAMILPILWIITQRLSYSETASNWMALLLVVFTAVGASLFWLQRHRGRPEPPDDCEDEISGPLDTSWDRLGTYKMAMRLEAEIFRRAEGRPPRA